LAARRTTAPTPGNGVRCLRMTSFSPARPGGIPPSRFPPEFFGAVKQGGASRRHASRLTLHASRFTLHASRFTHVQIKTDEKGLRRRARLVMPDL